MITCENRIQELFYYTFSNGLQEKTLPLESEKVCEHYTVVGLENQADFELEPNICAADIGL